MPPENSKIYHIVHLDRLESIIKAQGLYCDRIIRQMPNTGTMVGMGHIKDRRLNELKLTSYPDLFVGDCVPFYYSPRSVMLYMINQQQSQQINYKGGQNHIVHLQADLRKTLQWAKNEAKRWAMTFSNAGSRTFEDSSIEDDFNKLNWTAINSTYWQQFREEKQAEFLLEHHFPWYLFEEIGVIDLNIAKTVTQILNQYAGQQPSVTVHRNWYY